MNLATAQRLSLKIVREIEPFCEKIEIAGSVRRSRAEVNDIDIVLIPKLGLRPIVDRITINWRQISGEKGDAQNLRFLSPNGFQLDLFIAHGEIKDLVSTAPSNWGSVLLCRTGSKQHNIQLCSRAHAHGLKYAPYRGILKADKIIASATEEEIYAALGLPWLDPRERETLPSVSSVKSVVPV